MSVLLVFCTCPDKESAQRIAQSLVEKCLAACVTVLPEALSIYRWNGAIERSTEAQLLIKTRRECFEALTHEVRNLHPYELPEWFAVEAVAGLDRYLAWIGESTSSPKRD